MNVNKLPAVGNLLKKCRWVEGNGKYCDRPVNGFVTRDEDRNKVRKYETFCPMHKYEADKQTDIEDEGLENV